LFSEDGFPELQPARDSPSQHYFFRTSSGLPFRTSRARDQALKPSAKAFGSTYFFCRNSSRPRLGQSLEKFVIARVRGFKSAGSGRSLRVCSPLRTRHSSMCMNGTPMKRRSVLTLAGRSYRTERVFRAGLPGRDPGQNGHPASRPASQAVKSGFQPWLRRRGRPIGSIWVRQLNRTRKCVHESAYVSSFSTHQSTGRLAGCVDPFARAPREIWLVVERSFGRPPDEKPVVPHRRAISRRNWVSHRRHYSLRAAE